MQPMEHVTETCQFLPKISKDLKIVDYIDTKVCYYCFLFVVAYFCAKERGRIYPQDYYKYSFECAAGNPSVDTRVFRKAVDGGLPWMVVKQLKHTTATKSQMSSEQINHYYAKFKERWAGLTHLYRMLYILVTNRQVSTTDSKAVLTQHEGI
jgi:hypothetical protein